MPEQPRNGKTKSELSLRACSNHRSANKRGTCMVPLLLAEGEGFVRSGESRDGIAIDARRPGKRRGAFCRSRHVISAIPRLKRQEKRQSVPALPFSVAEGEGFEPPEAFTSTVFKTAAIDRSANLPYAAYSVFTSVFPQRSYCSRIRSFCQSIRPKQAL